MKNHIHITGIVLAGGKSTRMGSEKGLVTLGNSSFIEHVLSALKQCVDNIIIVSSNPTYDNFEVTRVEDIIVDAGPVGGLYTGLYHSKTKYNLVVSCDVPLITTSVLEVLIDQIDPKYDVIQLQSKGETLPLIAVYKKTCADICLKCLDNGVSRLRDVVNHLNTKTIALPPEYDTHVQNINTLEHLNTVKDEYDN